MGVAEGTIGTTVETEGQKTPVSSAEIPAKSANEVSPPKSYTQEDIDKAVQRALSSAGRDFKGLTDIKKSVDAAVSSAQQLLERAEARQRELDQRELDAVKENPDMLALIREKQALRNERLTIEREKASRVAEEAKIASEVTEARQVKIQVQIDAIVAEQKIDPNKLGELIDDTVSIERIAKIASALPKVVTQTPRSDSGDTHGGAAPTILQIRQDYIAGKIPASKYAEECIKRGIYP